MVRTLGFLLGGLMLANGVTDTLRPNLGFRLWNKYMRRHMPESVNEDVAEYSRLSVSARRYLSVWEMLIALTVLWLASRARG